jgi:hypothetical protein
MLKCCHFATFHLIMQMPEVAKKPRTPREPFKNNMTVRDVTEDTELMNCGDTEVIPNLGRTFSPSSKCATVA